MAVDPPDESLEAEPPLVPEPPEWSSVVVRAASNVAPLSRPPSLVPLEPEASPEALRVEESAPPLFPSR
jgi:hypothetical protein